MAERVLEHLDCRPGMVVVDCTLGEGGHAMEIVKRIAPGGKLIGIDRDAEVLPRARRRLEDSPVPVTIRHLHYAGLAAWAAGEGVTGIDGALFDLGLSSYQLDDPDRGFSFRRDGTLDMRMDRAGGPTAAELVNRLPVAELERIFFRFGQERWSRRIARAIGRERRRGPIRTTAELASIVSSAVPGRGRIHPATRVFQALRIAVNRELDDLAGGLESAWSLLRSGGRLCAISFHSLEDRIVKNLFRRWAREEGSGRILTRKPEVPGRAETARNPRSRSAKLRAIEHN